MRNDGKKFEELIAYVFRHILNIKDDQITVEQRVTIKGLSGVGHEFDLFYKFSKAGIEHRVAIECKNTNRAAELGSVMTFVGKLNDCRDVLGIFISANGYQSGAKEYGKKHGLILLEERDLPSFPQMLAERLSVVGLPDETYVGEPFWVIMLVGQNNRVTGTYYATDKPFLHIPIYFSKVHAEIMLGFLNSQGKRKYVVRGLTQYALRAFIILTKMMNVRIMICQKEAVLDYSDRYFGYEITSDELQKQYYYGEPIKFPKTNHNSNPETFVSRDDKDNDVLSMASFINFLSRFK